MSTKTFFFQVKERASYEPTGLAVDPEEEADNDELEKIMNGAKVDPPPPPPR